MLKQLRKLILFVLLIFACQTTANANVMPHYVSSINSASIGVYQATNEFYVYDEPNDNAQILFKVKWNTENFLCEQISASNLFVVFLQNKNLAYLSVADENEDETWVQIIYNKNGMQRGWIKKDEDFRYMNWRTFFNMYGRKYGLYYMKDAPEFTKKIYSSNEDNNQQTLGLINSPLKIKLQSVSGNWLLAIITEIDKSQKIGWLNWRSVNGEIYMFPDLK